MKNCIRILVLLFCFSAFPSTSYAQTEPKVVSEFSQSSIKPIETITYTVEIVSLKDSDGFNLEFPNPAFFGLNIVNQSSDQESYKANGQLWTKHSYHFSVNLSDDALEAGVNSFELPILNSAKEVIDTLGVPAAKIEVISDSPIWVIVVSIFLLFMLFGFLGILYLKKKKNKMADNTSHMTFEDECVTRIDHLEFKSNAHYQSDLKTLRDVLDSFVQKRYNIDLENLSGVSSLERSQDHQDFENERNKIKEFAHEITELRYAASEEKTYEAKRLSSRVSSYIESKKIIPVKM